MTHILMVAAENDGLRPVQVAGRQITGKVGGIGDVVRDVPAALAVRGCQVTVVTPGYGVFASQPEARPLKVIDVGFAGGRESVHLCEVPARVRVDGVRHLVLEHPLFRDEQVGRIYCDDPPDRPFARDATKFALFCAAVAEGVGDHAFGGVDVIHLHDWHAALLLLLRRFAVRCRALRRLRCVYTIHNLALQGVRPLFGDPSSLGTWFPRLQWEPRALIDPRWPDCINPMAVGIRLADAVHTVSPSYAREILAPSDLATRAYYGGEGLEGDLRAASDAGRLIGILNGCEYPTHAPESEDDWPGLLAAVREQSLRWLCVADAVSGPHMLAHIRLGDMMPGRRPGMLVTSVGRLTDQKMRILRQPTSEGAPALHSLLGALGEGGMLLLLGSGDAGNERFLAAAGAEHSNLLFLQGYSDALARTLYSQGDLFLMPSSFEPCGISQMLAMRAGQPCLVHHVGGLKDTVVDGETGFAFTGESLRDQADQLVATFRRALALRHGQPDRWRKLREAAAAARFAWSDSADAYLRQLYQMVPR